MGGDGFTWGDEKLSLDSLSGRRHRFAQMEVDSEYIPRLLSSGGQAGSTEHSPVTCGELVVWISGSYGVVGFVGLWLLWCWLICEYVVAMVTTHWFHTG